MTEKLKGMVEQKIFVRIAVAAVGQGTQNLSGMQELTALYLAMGWSNAEEVVEIMAYAQQQFAPTLEEVPVTSK